MTPVMFLKIYGEGGRGAFFGANRGASPLAAMGRLGSSFRSFSCCCREGDIETSVRDGYRASGLPGFLAEVFGVG